MHSPRRGMESKGEHWDRLPTLRDELQATAPPPSGFPSSSCTIHHHLLLAGGAWAASLLRRWGLSHLGTPGGSPGPWELCPGVMIHSVRMLVLPSGVPPPAPGSCPPECGGACSARRSVIPRLEGELVGLLSPVLRSRVPSLCFALVWWADSRPVLG